MRTAALMPLLWVSCMLGDDAMAGTMGSSARVPTGRLTMTVDESDSHKKGAPSTEFSRCSGCTGCAVALSMSRTLVQSHAARGEGGQQHIHTWV